MEKIEILNELKMLESTLSGKTGQIENKVDAMDASRKEREGERKAIFLREVKKLLVVLNDVDKKVSQDLKMEAFDNIRSMKKLKEDIASFVEKIDTASNELKPDEVAEQLNIIRNKAASIEESFSVSNLSLSVCSNQEHLTFMSNTIRSAAYLKTPDLDPHHYALDCSPMFVPAAVKDSSIEFRIHCNLPTRKFNRQVLAKLYLCISCPDGSHLLSKRILEEGSMEKLIRKKKAFLATPSTLVIQVKKPRNLVVTMEVKLLETDVLNSPKVFNFLWSSEEASSVQDITRLDTTGTGRLCHADLDMTDVDDLGVADAPVPSSTSTPASPSPADSPNPDSSIQPSGPTPPKQSRLSSLSTSDESDRLTYISTLDRTNPHFSLNASLAPGNQTLEATYLPDPCWDDSQWCPSLPQSDSYDTANATLWEVSSTPSVSSLFLATNMQYECAFRALPDELSTRRTQTVLVSPYDITLYPRFGVYLISEPHSNRVGVYSASDMKYYGLFGKGLVEFDYPTSILALSSGGLVLLDRTKMNIFNDHCLLEATFNGRFYGLTEGENDEIFTFCGHDCTIVRLGIGRATGMYYVKQRICLKIMKEFENWRSLSRPSHILYSMGRIMMSDKGLHKIFTIDLVSGQHGVWGYLGYGLGQFRRPCGMVVDDEGNLLVIDQGNHRLLVFKISGSFVKVAALGPDGYKQPSGLSVVGNTVMVTFMGNKEGMGGVIQYKMKA